MFFIFFNANEDMTVPFVELARVWSRVGHLRFFYLHWITSLSIFSRTGLILTNIFLITYILLSGCLCIWSNPNVPLIHLTIRAVSGDQVFNTEKFKGGRDLGALNYWGSQIVGETSDFSPYHASFNWIFLIYYYFECF